MVSRKDCPAFDHKGDKLEVTLRLSWSHMQIEDSLSEIINLFYKNQT